MNALKILRVSFIAMLALLSYSSLEAYRIQRRAVEGRIEVYQTEIRLWEANSRVREGMGDVVRALNVWVTNPDAEQAAAIRKRLDDISANGAVLGTIARENWVGLRSGLKSFREAAEAVLETPASRLTMDGAVRQADAQRRRVDARVLTSEHASRVLDRFRREEEQFARSRSAAMVRLLWSLAVCLIVGIPLAYFSLAHARNLTREKVRQYEETVRARRELELLSGRLVELQEEERRQLSRELHDEVGQSLTALRIDISRARMLCGGNGSEQTLHLDRAKALAESTLRAVRNISSLLRPSSLDDLGLVPALLNHAAEFTRRTGISCEVHNADPEERMPEAWETCVYRVVQEALNNTAKHSGAQAAHVYLAVTGDSLKVRIEDDGIGFCLGANNRPLGRKGLGILGMSERAARLGGLITLEASQGAGVNVELTLPAWPGRLSRTRVPDGMAAVES